MPDKTEQDARLTRDWTDTRLERIETGLRELLLLGRGLASDLADLSESVQRERDGAAENRTVYLRSLLKHARNSVEREAGSDTPGLYDTKDLLRDIDAELALQPKLSPDLGGYMARSGGEPVQADEPEQQQPACEHLNAEEFARWFYWCRDCGGLRGPSTIVNAPWRLPAQQQPSQPEPGGPWHYGVYEDTWLVYSGTELFVELTEQNLADRYYFWANSVESARVAVRRLNTLEQQLAEILPWKQDLEDIGVINWTLTEENSKDPKRLIYDTIAQLIREQIDPTISAQAAELAEQRRRAEQAEAELRAAQETHQETLRERNTSDRR